MKRIIASLICVMLLMQMLGNNDGIMSHNSMAAA